MSLFSTVGYYDAKHGYSIGFVVMAIVVSILLYILLTLMASSKMETWRSQGVKVYTQKQESVYNDYL